MGSGLEEPLGSGLAPEEPLGSGLAPCPVRCVCLLLGGGWGLACILLAIIDNAIACLQTSCPSQVG